MKLTSDDHEVRIGDSTVVVTGRTGPVHATWTLTIDGAAADSAAAAGDFRLTAALPDGSAVIAEVHQSLLGPTAVVVLHSGDEVGRFKGFVA